MRDHENIARLQFIAPLLLRESGLRSHYLPVPDDIFRAVLAWGSRRVWATINGHRTNRAIQGGGEVEPFLLLGRPVVKAIGASVGDVIPVDLEPDPNPEEVTLCDEFFEVLELDDEAARRFNGMTAGRRRGLAHYVNGAKRSETRIKRALEIAEKLRTYTLHGDR